MKTSSLTSRLAAFVAIALSTCSLAHSQTVIIYPQVTVVDASTPGYYNSALGTILDGTAPQFPLPLGSGGGDPLIYPSAEPNLAAATNVLGNWLTPHSTLNANWQQLASIPATWAGNTETAIIYEINGGTHGITNLFGDFDADNGLFIWVNGQFKFGARGPGLPSPAGQFEYTNVFLGNLLPGTNRIQILREDNFDATGYQVRIAGISNSVSAQPSTIPVALQSAAATFSQVNPSLGWDFPVHKAIDGNLTDNLGWAIAVYNQTESITNQTAVFETVTNVGFAGGTRLTFTLIQAHDFDFVYHMLGRFRISVTTDERSLFADGLHTGGDVTANWTVLNPETVSSSNGATLTKLADLSVLAGGTLPTQDTYVFSATTTLTGITGIRLEAMEDASLPYNGPGRQPLNGNFVLTEFLVHASPSSVLDCVPAVPNLLSWWKAETSGFDSIGTNTGTFPYGIAYTNGVVGQAFDFDGSQRRVSIADNPAFQLTNAMTLEAWVYPRAYGGFITFRGDNRGGLDTWTLDTYQTGFVNFQIDDEANNYASVLAPIALNQWQHVAATWDRTSSSMKIYINGNLVQQTNTSIIPVGVLDPSSEPAIGIGNHGGTFHQFPFNGLIDELGIFNRALTATEIQAIYSVGSAGKCAVTNPPGVNCAPAPSGLVSWWGLEASTQDSAGSNHGTLAGNTSFGQAKVGQGLFFDGSADVVSVGSATALQLQDFSIETWVRRTSTAQVSFGSYGNGVIFGFGQNGYGLYLDPNGVPALSKIGINETKPAVSITDTNFHHLAVTKSGSTVVFYVDGVSYSAPAYDPGFTFATVAAIGARGDNLDNSFLGVIDEVSVYNRALTTNEIQSIYNSSTAGKCPLPPPPLITQHPLDSTVNANATAQFTVAATGAPTLRYQWFFAGNPLPNATNTSLSIPNALPINQGTYFVTVSNDFGFAISSNATLTVLTFPPVITRQPTNTAVIVGNTASLSVQATGSVTLAYQWLLNGSPLAGKTTTTLSFTSVQFTNAGNYSVIVTNPYGAVTSSVATLTVNPIPPCVAVHDGLVSWWKGENNAIDNWDSNNGSSPFGASSIAGKVGLTWRTPFISVNDSPSLRVTNGLTLEAWVNPSTLSSVRVLVSKFDYPLFQPGVSQSAYLLGTTNNGALFFTLTPNGSVRTNTTLVTTNLIPLNQWTHVAATYDGSVMRLYINGSQIGQTNYTGKIFPGSAPLGIGGFPGGTSSPWQYSGLIDEVSLYNRALSAAEIQSIVAADLTGKCLAPPVITQQPQDQIVPLGEDVKFTVGVSGSRPLAYQWYFNGSNPQNRIIGATNASLIIEKIRTNNAGFYFVTVTNSVGSNFSARAQLSTLPAPSCVDVLPGIISWWPGDTSLLDAMGLNNAASYSPGTYPTGKIGSAFTFNGINSRVAVNSTASLNFTNNQNLSIEMWIKAANTNSANANVPLLEKRDTVTTGWLGYSLSLNNGKLAFALGAIKSPAGGTTNQMFISTGPDLRDGFFHHVAVTLNRAENNGGVLYVDGSPVLVFDPRISTNSLVNQLPLYIGGPATTLSNSYYTGLIDEPAIYGRALTPVEILSIRTAGAAGRCRTKPLILTQPVGGLVALGSNFTMSVVAIGTPQLRYQWRQNNASLNGATNSTLTLSNVFSYSLAGTYSVIVSNAFGSVISSNAIVVISNRPPTALSGSFAVNEDRPIDVLLTGTDPEQNPLTYSIVTQPTNGILSGAANSRFRVYTPRLNYNGPDFFTYKVNDGFSDSAIATMTITVSPVNDAPTAASQEVATDEDAPLNITLQGSDVDGDIISFEIVQQPVHGVLSGTLPNLTYTPAQDYFGSDYFTFVTRDPSNAVSQLAAVSITVRPVNDAPVARIVVTPLDQLPGETNTVLISPACCDTTLVLDGSQSSDVENSPLTYIWMDGTNVIATTATLTNQFSPGLHEFTLIVSDGELTGTETLIVEILKTEEAVLHLQSLVQDSSLARNEKAALGNWLRVTVTALEHCNVDQAVMFLERFEGRVAERISVINAKDAERWITISQAIREVAGLCDPAHRPGGGNGNQENPKSKSEQESSSSGHGAEASEVRGGKSSPR